VAKAFVRKTFQHFEEITDPRVNRGANHSLIEMIFLTLCATICGADSWTDVERYGTSKLDWLRQLIPLENGIPSHDTLGRVFSRLDSLEFYACLQSWTNDICQSLKGQTVAVDGKTLRGSFDRASGKSALHSVSAWVCGLRMCLGLKSVDDKSNEIPAVQELIAMLDLEGAVITADAMHCQKETVQAIVAKEADYLLIVKGNQPTLEDALHQAIIEAMNADDGRTRRTRKAEKNRNRLETREVIAMKCPEDHPVFKDWESLETIGVIHRRREIDGRVEEATETFITSLPCKVRDIAERLRDHWSTENQQHHILDVTFNEDSSRIRKGTGPEISSVFRRLALSILQKDTSIKDRVVGKRKRCGWDNTALEKVLACFSST
jgi:predicted transposase YbfD/YdcC